MGDPKVGCQPSNPLPRRHDWCPRQPGVVVSTPARWRSLLDHREVPGCSTTGESATANLHPAGPPVPAAPSPLLRFSTTDHPQPRVVVSTLARWRSLLDHRERARCSTTG